MIAKDTACRVESRGSSHDARGKALPWRPQLLRGSVIPASPQSLNIAHVIGSFEVGGAERVALALAGSQREQGHRVHAISLMSGPPGPLAHAFSDCGVLTRTIAKRPGFDTRLSAKLAAFFARDRVDVVHVHNPQPLIYGAPAGRLANTAVIYTKHGANRDLGRRVWLRRAAAVCVDAYVAVSDATAEVARKDHEARENKLLVIQNGIDTSKFCAIPSARASVRRALGLPLNARVIGSVGRLSRPKSHDVLLRAAAPMLAEHHGAYLLFVGDGPERGNLERLAGRLGVHDRVVFTGNRDDVARILNALDVFVLSSRSEGLPLVVIEAMATQLPVIASAVGGLPSVIEHERTGLLVSASDDLALRVAIGQVLVDEDRARALGRRAREAVLERFSLQEMSRAHLSLYDRVLRQRRFDSAVDLTHAPVAACE
jgi:glycosyltransferase involved in cell wall biosynthesis